VTQRPWGESSKTRKTAPGTICTHHSYSTTNCQRLERNPTETSIELIRGIITYANRKPKLSTISAAFEDRHCRVGNPRDPHCVPDVVEVPTGVNAGDGMNSRGVVVKFCEVRYFERKCWRFRTRGNFIIRQSSHSLLNIPFPSVIQGEIILLLRGRKFNLFSHSFLSSYLLSFEGEC